MYLCFQSYICLSKVQILYFLTVFAEELLQSELISGTGSWHTFQEWQSSRKLFFTAKIKYDKIVKFPALLFLQQLLSNPHKL